MILEIICLSIFLNIIYYIISQRFKVKIFINYLRNFFVYTLIVYVVAKVLDYKLIYYYFVEFIILYILFFISLFLSMSMKYIKSPTYLVFLCLKRRRKIKEIIKFLKTNKVIKVRISDLNDQGLISIKKKKIILKKNLGVFINILFLIKNFLNLKSEG